MRSIASEIRIQRLVAGHEPVAVILFEMMAFVLEEEGHSAPLDSDYVRSLLARPDFVALAAIQDGEVVGGVTGHVLPMTRSRSSELFIYDLAVTRSIPSRLPRHGQVEYGRTAVRVHRATELHFVRR